MRMTKQAPPLKTMTETYRRVPNQENREDIKQPYLYVERESVDTAKRNLSANAFILWLYLVRYNDNVKCSFSMREFCKWAGLPYSTGAHAKEELLDNGYLVQVEDNIFEYSFCERPQQ